MQWKLADKYMDKRTMLILRKHIPTVLRNMRSQSVPDSGMAMRLVHFFLRLKLLMPQLSASMIRPVSRRILIKQTGQTISSQKPRQKSRQLYILSIQQFMDGQMETYVKEAASLGVTAMDAKMMCANFRHQGGLSAVKRILAKTTKPYTLDHLYTACQTDTGNQVGAYKSRQKMVYNALKTYITNYKVTASDAIQAAINIAKAEIGYREKASNANLDSKTANAGTANYTKYWRDVAPEYQGQAWCACFISWVFMKAFNKSKASELLKHWPYISVPNIY